jgi:hypothetical protein
MQIDGLYLIGYNVGKGGFEKLGCIQVAQDKDGLLILAKRYHGE